MARYAITLALSFMLAPLAAAAGDILRIANPGHPASLDPHRITGVWENRIVGDMLMGLTTEGPGGEVTGGAAESWDVSADGLRYEFRLRKHLWSDGAPVTAEDFVYSFRRMMSGETTSPYAQFFWVIENGQSVTSGDAPPEALGVEALAADRRIITGRVLGSGERPAWGLVPPGTADYPAPAHPEWHDQEMDERRERAQGLMREAGFGPRAPLRVHLRYPLSENERRVAIALQSMWRGIFIAAELDRAETAIHYSALQQGDFDLGLASWLAVYDDAQTFTLLLQTESGPNNLGNYSHPEYDRLADAASREADSAARARLLSEAETLAMREQALIPLYHHSARNLVSPRVIGWQDNMLDVNRSRYLGLAEAQD